MSVYPVADPEGNGEEYYFECDDNGDFSGGWFDVLNPPLDPDDLPTAGPNEYYVEVFSPNRRFTYRVRTRDQSPNQNVSTDSTDESVP